MPCMESHGSSPPPWPDLEETLAREIKSFQQRASSQQKLGQAGPSRFQASEASEESSSGFLATLEKVCVLEVIVPMHWGDFLPNRKCH